MLQEQNRSFLKIIEGYLSKLSIQDDRVLNKDRYSLVMDHIETMGILGSSIEKTPIES